MPTIGGLILIYVWNPQRYIASKMVSVGAGGEAVSRAAFPTAVSVAEELGLRRETGVGTR